MRGRLPLLLLRFLIMCSWIYLYTLLYINIYSAKNNMPFSRHLATFPEEIAFDLTNCLIISAVTWQQGKNIMACLYLISHKCIQPVQVWIQLETYFSSWWMSPTWWSILFCPTISSTVYIIIYLHNIYMYNYIILYIYIYIYLS